MCSTRNAAACLAGAALAVTTLTGCQWIRPPATEKLNAEPIVIDEAMQLRNWDLQTSYYQNGVTVAGPTGKYFEPDPRLPPTAQAALETPLFLGHVILLPFDLLWDPPWEDVAYPRAQSPASYTQVPPSNVTY